MTRVTTAELRGCQHIWQQRYHDRGCLRSARRVRDLGGTGGKIMVYLRSDTPQANSLNMALLEHCVADFAEEDLLPVVELLTYALEGESPDAYARRIPELIQDGTTTSLMITGMVLK